MLHNPTVQVPPWPLFEPYSPSDSDEPELADPPVDVYSCDEFRMYEFKIRRCARGRSHDWTECPYAHPGEKARRRDPRKFHYAGTPCPDFRKGNCKKGDACEFAHGVFECWLHPARYRTQPCKDGTACRRRVCFFAHTPDQLRVLSPKVPESYDGSPMRYSLISSPRSTLISPPMSPPSDYSPPLSPSGLAIWLRRMQLGNANSAPWQRGASGFSSLPSTPKRKLVVGSGVGWMEEPTTERTGLCKSSSNGNSSEGVDAGGEMAVPDVGWVSELVK